MKKDVEKEPNYTIEVIKMQGTYAEKTKYRTDDMTIVSRLRKEGNIVTIIDSKKDQIFFSNRYGSVYGYNGN